jgi:hypothetical protein
VAAGAEVPRLAGEGEEIFVGASVAANTGKAVVQDAAGEELVGNLSDYRPPVAMDVRESLFIDRVQVGKVILHEPEERGSLWAARFVDSWGGAWH